MEKIEINDEELEVSSDTLALVLTLENLIEEIRELRKDISGGINVYND